jgi:hypothetical protein
MNVVTKVAGGTLASLILGCGPSASVHPYTAGIPHSTPGQGSIYHEAEKFIRRDHIKVPWDGRYSYNEKTELCLELFNGTTHDIRIYGGLLAPGFYIRTCEGNNKYTVHDGTTFKGMETY